ncbi:MULTISPECIES: YbgC/FadM family acyl-CoA thioesterase [Rhodomicrobium]|uniref:YbgC/FadM family acyl-CoA thioesterase n=1 Tax=Rhodomicrobium TaxID=1068 RepID=UPI000B4AABDC|nr:MULTISPECIES: YbgC/FadM family acyl-CoA thioesterase [Rhodomicrobium]
MTPPSERWPDLAGRIVGRRHILPVRVYFEDTDFSGLVYHANYLRWCERGRSDMLRLLGVHHFELHAPGDGGAPAAFVVRRLEVDYLRPARIDELLEIVTECAELGGAHLTMAQEVRRGERTLCRLSAKIVLISQTGKPLRLPPAIVARFKE